MALSERIGLLADDLFDLIPVLDLFFDGLKVVAVCCKFQVDGFLLFVMKF